MTTLQFDYDKENDILTVEGIRYSGVLFRQLGETLPVGNAFVIEARADGVLCIRDLRLVVKS